MAKYRIEGQIVEADSPEAAYAQLDALSEEDVADVERLRARQATGGLAGLGGEIASWALPFTMAGRVGAKLGQAATRGALPRTSAIGGAAAGEGALMTPAAPSAPARVSSAELLAVRSVAGPRRRCRPSPSL
jgi:hypothetical protein